MNKRITLGIVTVAAVGALSAVLIGRYAKTSGSGDHRLVDTLTGRSRTVTAVPESAATRGKRLARPVSGAEEVTRRRRKSESETLIEDAAVAGKYTFVFFYSADDERVQSMRRVFQLATSDMADRAVPVEVDISKPRERFLVDRFKVSGAPMPLVLAIAPNGAITGGFPAEFDEEQLRGAFASPCTEKSLKALQDRKLVFVCVQNDKTESNEAAMEGVYGLKADRKFGNSTEIVMLDPTDPAESLFLSTLQVDGQTRQAVTVCLVPPGHAVAKFAGATEKEAIVAALTSSGGCGPGGCGPGGCGK